MPIRIRRVYTRTGDQGTTSLVGGKRVTKDSQRIEAYGCVDELNALVGMTRAFNQKIKGVEAKELEIKLKVIQNELFDVGSELATPQEVFIKGMPQVEKEQIKRLEQEMDLYQKEVTPLKSFVLPGGGIISSLLHHCRTVCRRTEREIFRLGNLEKINPQVFIYINRLSDWFFVLSRWVSKRYGEKEFLWERGLRKPPLVLKRKKRPIQ